MTRQISCIGLVTAAFLLIAGVSIEALPMTNQTNRAISHLREVLLHDAWAHDVRVGRIAVETCVLVFLETGKVSERVYDDTGVHEAAGSWRLEESDGIVILILTGENLRNKGRFTLRQDAKGDGIELRGVGGERAVRFQRRKGYRDSR